jgi:hypothetical protein
MPAGSLSGRSITLRAAPVLHNLIVYDPVSNFADFHVRLAGSGYFAHFGYDVTAMARPDLFD